MKLFEKKWYWLFVGTVTGAAVMALEISASRLLAPYFGTSTIIWSSVIGIVLLVLSAGYYAGGKLAEWKLEYSVLLRCILACGLLVLLIPLIAPALLTSMSSAGQGNLTLFLAGGSLLTSFALFGVPVFLLGLVSPYLLALLTKQFGHIGSTSGQLFALSTLGGLAGTFLPTLLLIPWIGTTQTILATGLALTVLGLPGLLQRSRKVTTALLAAGLVAASVLDSTTPAKVLAQTESPYQHIMIIDEGEGGRSMRFDAGFGFQSVYHPDHLLTGLYYDYASLLPSLTPPTTSAKKILLIGLAGGTIPRLLHEYYGSNVDMEAVELDAQSTELARQYMGLDQVPITIHHQDGRQFLRSATTDYDVIYVDVYHNELQIPWTLTTKEFWTAVKRRLTPNGVAGMNIAALGAEESSLAATIANTAASVFSHTYDAQLADHRSSSHLLLMSSGNIDLSRADGLTASHPELKTLQEHLAARLRIKNFDSSALVLTDDRAPIEWLMAKDSLH